MMHFAVLVLREKNPRSAKYALSSARSTGEQWLSAQRDFVSPGSARSTASPRAWRSKKFEPAMSRQWGQDFR